MIAPINNFVKSLLTIRDLPSDKGNVVSFYYDYYNHDPFPVILTTGIMRGGNRIGGLNLHYLTFPVYKALLNNWAGNNTFNYYLIKNQPLIKQAFRSYKFEGIRNAKSIEWKSILEVLSIIRNYSPQEIQQIRDAVDKQILQRQPEIINEIFGNMINQFNQLNQLQQNIDQNIKNNEEFDQNNEENNLI